MHQAVDHGGLVCSLNFVNLKGHGCSFITFLPIASKANRNNAQSIEVAHQLGGQLSLFCGDVQWLLLLTYFEES